VKRIGVFLIAAALVAGMAGCVGVAGGSGGGGSEESYTLTVLSTAGGSVTNPGVGNFTCTEGEVVNLFAKPEEGYHFVDWTGDVGTIANVNSALTAITTDDSYSVRANFLEGSLIPPGINYTEAQVGALIVVLVNDERQEFDLSTLTEDALLTSLATEHSISMVESNFFCHARYPGERPVNYGKPVGTIRGENLARIPTRQAIPGPYLSLQEVCEWAVSGWMDSPGHRANILAPRYNETGVGACFSDGGDYLYITQMFEGPYQEGCQTQLAYDSRAYLERSSRLLRCGSQ
jgi:uncharacterized protein YkwD